MGIKIKLDLDADTQKLSDAIQRAVARGFQGAGSSGLATNPAQVANQIAGNDAGFSSSAVGMKRRSIGNLNMISPASPSFLNNPGFFLSNGPKPPNIAAYQAQQQAQRASFLKNIGFAGIPLLSPGSVLGNLFASRQIFSGLSGPVGQKALGGLGLAGTAGTALATGGVMAVLLAVGASIKLLITSLKETAKTFDEARKLYAKTLLSGMGLRFTAGRNNLADVLGVSEKEVLQFGAAIALIGPKLKFATDIMARTTPNLTSVAYEFEIMKKNLQALFMVMANDAAPAIRKFLDGISELIQMFTVFYQKFHEIIGKIASILASSFQPELVAIAKIIGALGKDIGAAPQPQGLMKQLPVSALERMGLIVGGFGAGNDAPQRTAKATERTAKLLEKLVSQASGAGGSASFFDPFYNSP